MKLFLCSHFSSVGSLIKEEIENKKVAFIPTASLREGYTGYVGSARKLFNKLGATVTEIDISTEAYSTIQSVFEEADVIYFTGGNSFFLMDQLRKTGADGLLKKELANGKLMIGESAGAIICAPSIQYIEQMDKKPEDYSQEDDGMLPVKRTIKINKFLYRQPCYGWRYFMLLLYIAHDISLVSLHAVSFEVVGCCSNLCN